MTLTSSANVFHDNWQLQSYIGEVGPIRALFLDAKFHELNLPEHFLSGRNRPDLSRVGDSQGRPQPATTFSRLGTPLGHRLLNSRTSKLFQWLEYFC